MQLTNLLWFQAGACSGDTMSLLNAEKPDLIELLGQNEIRLIWHPSLSLQSTDELAPLIDQIQADRLELTMFCVEGAVLHGPDQTGLFDSWHGVAKKNVIRDLCAKAKYVMAIGTCAAYGGIPASGGNPADATGLQWFKAESGGLLGSSWRSLRGLPVINVPGCPAHPNTVVQTMLMVLRAGTIELDHLNRPAEFFETIVHQGCPRNEYHEYDVEDSAFGGKGCLYFNLGCQGPFTSATCNTIPWNTRSSKQRAGVPCFGCTSPFFPRDKNLFKTDKIGPIPLELPLGVKRSHYMAYKGLAKAATPQRLIDRKNRL